MTIITMEYNILRTASNTANHVEGLIRELIDATRQNIQKDILVQLKDSEHVFYTVPYTIHIAHLISGLLSIEKEQKTNFGNIIKYPLLSTFLIHYKTKILSHLKDIEQEGNSMAGGSESKISFDNKFLDSLQNSLKIYTIVTGKNKKPHYSGYIQNTLQKTFMHNVIAKQKALSGKK